ncbi:hypothetical protein H5410_061543 [Solanum commersonii]|uniref:Pentatricopeptide repeat-containing protein n=1 Tax=Solanum commersonii TaxID=4109 RepID=A0A9J5W8C0_SOLCO|nr:hypothetical protein H5410_061543 [Solanum commersonii]
MSAWTCTLSASPVYVPLQQPSNSFTQNPPRKLLSTSSPTSRLIFNKNPPQKHPLQLYGLILFGPNSKSLQDLNLGKQIYGAVVKFGYDTTSVTMANSIIHLLGRCGGSTDDKWELALEAFRLIGLDGFEASSFTLVSIALACSNLPRTDGLRREGWMIQELLADRDIVSWNTIITSFSQNDQFQEEIKPDGVTISRVVPACSHLTLLDVGKQIHYYVLKNDDLIGNSFVDSSLVGMYSICQQCLEKEHWDMECYAGWLAGYTQNGFFTEALMLFIEMMEFSGLSPNPTTVASVFPACQRAKRYMLAYAIRNALAMEIAVGSALVDMYAKCVCLDIARRVFDSMTSKNVITWNVLIMAYGMHGKGEEALELFRMMVLERKVKPNNVTFIAIFAGCGSGIVPRNGIEPTADHYACIVDLLGRSGHLEEAYQLVNEMPSKIELGEISARNLFELDPHVASHYVLLSNIYSSAGIWEKASMVRHNMKKVGVRKEPGCSWIEFVGDKVNSSMAISRLCQTR